MLVVDMSASGRFGTVAKLKSQIATELSAVIALSAITNNDNVGLILFTDKVERFIPPQKGKNRALRLIRELLTFEPESTGTDIGGALQYLHTVTHRRSMVFVISDFFGELFEKPLQLVHRRHDVIPVCLIDRRDLVLPAVGFVRLHDLETGQEVLVDTDSAKVRRRFEDLRRRAAIDRRRLFRGLGLDVIDVRTDEPYLQPLLRFFRRRERRLGEGR